MASGKVECPICSLTVNESDINLHLDLQCRGAGTSTSVAGPSSTPTAKTSSAASSSSQGGQRSSQGKSNSPGPASGPTIERDPEVTPSSKPRMGARRSSKGTPVAPIFAASIPASVPPTASASTSASGSGTGSSSKRKASGGTQEEVDEPTLGLGSSASTKGTEKRPRLNPLTANQPLAERSRPSTLANYIGQEDLVGTGSLLRARIEAGEGIGSAILWGPPGSGKTTLARLIAKTANADFRELSATSSGTADVRQVFEQAKNSLKLTGRRTILMVDEIHRFNKAQQDLFLPYVENGWVQLIGATTENPSFKVNGALLSRCQVFTLSPHTPESLEKILLNALSSLAPPLPHLPKDLLPFLADVADGDARQALNGLELALKVCDTPVYRQSTIDKSLSSNGNGNGNGDSSGNATATTPGDGEEGERKKRDDELMDAVRRGLRKGYDRSGEERYDMISALHKSLRGSDGSAAMYWLARMITGGEDALYIARRLVVMASEDVGLADPHALPLHCVAYLAEAPKSTRSYTAYKRAETLATTPPLPGVPLQIRNAPTQLMKKLGYGKRYSYNPDYAHPVYNEYLPHTLAAHSSLSQEEDQHILKTPRGETRGKTWDEDRLSEWEWVVNGDRQWEGRAREPSGVSNDGDGDGDAAGTSRESEDGGEVKTDEQE